MIPRRLRCGWLATCALAMVAATASGQLPFPSDIDFFGDDLPKKGPPPLMIQGRVVVRTPPPARDPNDKSQILVFRDGEQVHGQILAIDEDGILWKREDASEPLRFPRDSLRRIVLNFETNGLPVRRGILALFPQRVDDSEDDAPDHPIKPLPVTLKLPGGDWLFGEVSGTDGEKYTVRVAEKTLIDVPRDRLEWLRFASKPTPASGFFGSALDLAGWLPESMTAEVKKGTVSVEGTGGTTWIGQTANAPRRFQVELEVPPDAEDYTRLWLQPIGAQINSYTAGTVEIQFGKTQICRQLFVNQFSRQTTEYPKAALDEPGRKGPTNYRVFYDGVDRQIVVLRNGKKVGDWSFGAGKAAGAEEELFRRMRINGICLDRAESAEHQPLQFSRFEVRPWNGVLPAGGETATTEDRLFITEKPPIVGKLDSISNGELVFDGESHSGKAGTYVEFGNSPAALAEPLAKVDLGERGEFSVSKLEIHDGVVRCDTAFATGLEVPAQLVQTISFPNSPADPQPKADLLVFQNGDEIPGKALAASSSGTVRWRTAAAQKLEFQTERLAGIRLASATDGKPAGGASTVELRDGERLRGSLLDLDEKRVHWQHPQLGALTLDRSQVWHLFPSATCGIADGGTEPEEWLRPPGAVRGRTRRPKHDPSGWIHLDGTYIRRNSGVSMSPDPEGWDGLHREIPAGLNRFEVRLEAYGVVASSTCLLVRLTAGDTGSTWQGTITYSEVQLVVYGLQQNRRPNWREIPLQEKLTDLETRRAIRLFVDTKAGTCDLYVNGVLIVRTGQQAGERITPGKYTVHFQPYPNPGRPCVLSNLWIGPWSGELPKSETSPDATTTLSNGDATSGTPKTIRDGKLALDGEVGALEIPIEKIQEVDFGGKISTQPATTRLRFTDGTVMNMDQFHWDSQGLAGHSPTLGDLRLPSGVINEIIFHPTAPHAPIVPDAKKAANRDHATPAADEAAPPLEQEPARNAP
ncbi:MAG TPA: hypothetical protein VGM54_00360 [Chthoniobacter sp.]|jgi:hypothetical protein